MVKRGGDPCYIEGSCYTEKVGEDPCYIEGSCYTEKVGEHYGGTTTCGGCGQEDSGNCLGTESCCNLDSCGCSGVGGYVGVNRRLELKA